MTTETSLIETIRALVPQSNGKARNITLPGYMSFAIDEDTKLLRLGIKAQKDRNGKVQNAVCRNMQSDNAAFEGWAICLKAWLPKAIQRVELKWDTPKGDADTGGKKCMTENEEQHYRRFLYRALRFSELYDWFSVAADNADEIEAFKTELENPLKPLKNNSFSEPPGCKGGEKWLSETVVEYMFADKGSELSSQIMNFFGLDTIGRQFPVGVKQCGRQFFTGRFSAIDLWGTCDDILTIIELKYNGDKAKNVKVGIISELFMYSCIMRDIIRGCILCPDFTPVPCERKFYDNHDKYKKVRAVMFSDRFHPLVDNKDVISLLNDNATQKESIIVEFGKHQYKLDAHDYRLDIE